MRVLALSLCVVFAWAQPQPAEDADGSIRKYQAFLAQNPGRVDARSNLGVALVRAGRYQEAIEQYRLALAGAPPEMATHLRMNLALAYYKSGQLQQAVGELTTLRADFNATLLLADCHLRMGEFKRVIELLTPLAPEHGQDHAFAYLLGTALIRDGQVERGQAVVDPILRAGETAEAKFLLGSTLFMAQNYPAAVGEFAKAIALDPTLPSLNSFYGQALLFTGDPDGASAAFHKQLSEDPNDFDANLRLGEILLQRKSCSEALPLFEKALLVRPGAIEVRGSLAECEAALGRLEDARGEMETLLRARPDFAAAHAQLAGVLDRLGKHPEATRQRLLAQRLEAPAAVVGLKPGTLAPDFALAQDGADTRVRLSEFRGKPLVLVFGSYTCPKFRSQADTLNALYAKYLKSTAFLLVYIREAHATEDWKSTANEREGIAQPAATTFQQKREYASACVRRLKIPYRAVVDGMDTQVEKQYQGWPSRVYVVDARGRIVYNSLLDEQNFHAADLEKALASQR